MMHPIEKFKKIKSHRSCKGIAGTKSVFLHTTKKRKRWKLTLKLAAIASLFYHEKILGQEHVFDEFRLRSKRIFASTF